VQDRVGRKHSPDLARIDALDLPYVVITDEGKVLGMLTPGEVEQLALQHLRWDTVTIGEVMTPAERLVTVTPETEAQTALVYMAERRLEALLVVEDGEPVGCITARRLMQAMEGDNARRKWSHGSGAPPSNAGYASGSQLSLFDEAGAKDRTDAA
jgi:predicted transcriptional regulator